MNIPSKSFIQDTISFVQEAIAVCKEPNKDYTFTCPICGGEAHVYMVKSNRHHHGYCKGCEMNFAE